MTTRASSLTRICCAAAMACATASCGLRLPVDATPATQTPVSLRAELPADAPPREPDVHVWLTADRYHTCIVIPYDWLLESGFTPPENFGMPRFVVMSWGNNDAYSIEGFDHPWKVFRVLFTPTRSVMELIPVNWNVPEVLPDHRIWQARVPRERGPSLAAFLNDCAATEGYGRPVVVRESSWGNGVQIESRHSYFIPRVCNVWTAQALEATGGEYRPWFAISANGLIRQAENPRNGFEKIWPGGGAPQRRQGASAGSAARMDSE